MCLHLFWNIDLQDLIASTANAFSLKESIYKAIHPELSQYVGFQEVEAQPYADGTAHCTINLESGGESALSSVTARWRKVCDNNEVFFLTSATSQRAT